MEFNEKLQLLRKQKGLTQEALAEFLFVSRTAVSKWESARGYPNIDSLKAIAAFFSISIDELLSGDELLSIAEENSRQREMHLRSLVFSLLDCSCAIFFFFPLFAQKTGGVIQMLPLLSLSEISLYLRCAYFAVTLGLVLSGVLGLALKNCSAPFRLKISLGMTGLATLLFIISRQVYAAAFLFMYLTIKALLLIKWS